VSAMVDPARIVIATPVLGSPDNASVAWSYHIGVRALERCGAIMLMGDLAFSDDITRARSRQTWAALQRDGWDWLLFWDSDVAGTAEIACRMIERAEENGHTWVGAAYPRKRLPPMLPYRPLQEHLDAGQLTVVRDCIEVEGVGLGFTIVRRSTLEAMVSHYADELWFTDTHDLNNVHETIDIFDTMRTPVTEVNGRRFREKLSEDYAACRRWRQMGGRVQMYVGKGAPLPHVGTHAFVAEVADLGRLR